MYHGSEATSFERYDNSPAPQMPRVAAEPKPLVGSPPNNKERSVTRDGWRIDYKRSGNKMTFTQTNVGGTKTSQLRLNFVSNADFSTTYWTTHEHINDSKKEVGDHGTSMSGP